MLERFFAVMIRTGVLVLTLVFPGLAVSAQEPTPPAGEAPAAAAPARPQPFVPGEALIHANAAYAEGSYERAIELYEKLVANGYESGHVHYDLGNAYLRNGELGQAIASYRRSQAFLPRDQDVKANLAFARKSALDAIAPPEPSAVKRTLFFWHYSLSRAELGKIVVVLNLLVWTILVLRIYRRGSEVLRWTFFALLLALLTAGSSLAIRHLYPRRIAVIVPQEIDVRSGTSFNDTVLFKLHAGTEVRVVDRRRDFLRIALPEEGRGGWIEAQHAEVVAQ
jgi:hypothetical protein